MFRRRFLDKKGAGTPNTPSNRCAANRLSRMIFHGTPHYADALERIVRLCLILDVVPVFVLPRETGFQAMIESYNG